jgi:hypothetical protein
VLQWPDDKAEDRGLTVWHVADKDSQWFSPNKSSFMINYRVDNLGELLQQLRAGGMEVIAVSAWCEPNNCSPAAWGWTPLR